MSDLALSDTTPRAIGTPKSLALGAIGIGIALTLLQYVGLLPAWIHRVPETWVPPMAQWLDHLFYLVRGDQETGRFGLTYITRWIAEGPLEFSLNVTANLLDGKRRWPFLGPIPWSVIAAPVTVMAYALGGWRLACLAGVTCLWTALIGQWDIAMQTMSVLIIAAPLAFVFGLSIGIAAWKYPWVDLAIKPVLSLLQTLPFFTYLLPAVIFFKVGPTAGAVATMIYAMPPMILMTTLGLQKVPPEVVEAGKMSGANRFQMVRHVYLTSARTDILVGVNQVIMLCLAMVVLTAFIGMPGLGAKLLSNMGSFRLGNSFEIGVTIVLIAVTLDRMSKAWALKQPVHFEKDVHWWRRNVFLVLAVAAAALFLLLSQIFPILAEVGRRQNFSQGREIDALIKGALAVDWVQAVTGWLRAFFNVQVLIPFRNFLLSIPTPAFILFITGFACVMAGRREALLATLFFAFVAFSGWWDRAVITLYAVFAAVALATLISLPIGILASRSSRWSDRVLLICDTAQTFPSFIYLIPAIMLFGVTDIAVIFSILIFTMVPLTRYTIEGLRSVPENMIEAADMSGSTRLQKLWHVQFPMALPTLAVGFNQAIMFAFFMVIVAAFIGTQDLGQELQRTLAGTDLGKNFVLGLCVSLMALTFDLILMKWAADKKAALGLR